MRKEITAVSRDLEALAQDGMALLVATADVAEEQVVQARRRLAASIEKGRVTLGQLQEKVVQGARATDEMVHKRRYHAMGVALGAGALIGFLLSRRAQSSHEI